MQRCVDSGDLDGLLELASADEIAIAWHRYNDTPEPKSVDHPDWWAVELFMGRAILERTDLHRALLLELVKHASDDALWGVAAGPLEDFVSDDVPPDDGDPGSEADGEGVAESPAEADADGEAEAPSSAATQFL